MLYGIYKAHVKVQESGPVPADGDLGQRGQRVCLQRPQHSQRVTRGSKGAFHRQI